jgi:hypothetical protein
MEITTVADYIYSEHFSTGGFSDPTAEAASFSDPTVGTALHWRLTLRGMVSPDSRDFLLIEIPGNPELYYN